MEACQMPGQIPNGSRLGRKELGLLPNVQKRLPLGTPSTRRFMEAGWTISNGSRRCAVHKTPGSMSSLVWKRMLHLNQLLNETTNVATLASLLKRCMSGV